MNIGQMEPSKPHDFLQHLHVIQENRWHLPTLSLTVTLTATLTATLTVTLALTLALALTQP